MTDVLTETEAGTQSEGQGFCCSKTRRAVLLGAAGAGATAVLAACGTDTTGTNPNGSDFAADPEPAGSTGADAGGGSGGDSGGAAGGATLALAADVPSGGGIIQGDYVITQPTSGEYKAFSKICTHQGCEVNEVADGTINCPCHGAKFSITDGSPTSGPAQKALTETQVKVDGDNIVAA
ncbi:Rieske (2Fe-2S) protein [Actinoplanes sp. NPDC051851]|uniref:Rieske (2Fe-2S) protein n=1 Tax=Actinoplanes sp. NPDC051851 TaxID=3154753 RepID=UPI00341DB338